MNRPKHQNLAQRINEARAILDHYPKSLVEDLAKCYEEKTHLNSLYLLDEISLEAYIERKRTIELDAYSIYAESVNAPTSENFAEIWHNISVLVSIQAVMVS